MGTLGRRLVQKLASRDSRLHCRPPPPPPPLRARTATAPHDVRAFSIPVPKEAAEEDGDGAGRPGHRRARAANDISLSPRRLRFVRLASPAEVAAGLSRVDFTQRVVFHLLWVIESAVVLASAWAFGFNRLFGSVYSVGKNFGFQEHSTDRLVRNSKTDEFGFGF